MNKLNTKFNFIKKSLIALRIPTKKVAVYHDTTKHGLKLLVRPTGIKTFVLYRKIQGRPERVTIGRFPEVTIEQARKQVDMLNAKIASGVNPNEEKRTLRSEMTIKGLFERYLERYAKVHKKTWQEDANQYRRYLKGWENRRLSSIRRSHVQKLHAEVGTDKGHYAANRLLALLHTLFNRAIDWGWDKPNPAQGIKKFKEKSRDRFIHGDELPNFFSALREEPSIIVRDYILLSLLTGARRSNVLAMRWDEINFDRGTWTIPLTKSGESHTIPLVPATIDILKTRQKDNADNNPWVFSGAGVTGHLA